jgi:hypothetical protein
MPPAVDLEPYRPEISLRFIQQRHTVGELIDYLAGEGHIVS